MEQQGSLAKNAPAEPATFDGTPALLESVTKAQVQQAYQKAGMSSAEKTAIDTGKASLPNIVQMLTTEQSMLTAEQVSGMTKLARAIDPNFNAEYAQHLAETVNPTEQTDGTSKANTPSGKSQVQEALNSLPAERAVLDNYLRTERNRLNDEIQEEIDNAQNITNKALKLQEEQRALPKDTATMVEQALADELTGADTAKSLPAKVKAALGE